LASHEITLGGQGTNLLELLRGYRDYSQFRDAQGQWDRPALRGTLLAKFIAARYLIMQEDPVTQAAEAVENLQPSTVDTPLRPEDFIPGESLAAYFGRQADKARAENRQLVTWLRQMGRGDAEIAERLGWTVQQLLECYPKHD
jgi:hypothetical protein